MPDNRTTLSALRINTIGMDQRARDALELFFHNFCEDAYVLVEGEEADITIIDMDSVDASRHHENHLSKHPKRPTILISLLEMESENATFVKKPLQPGELKAALEDIRESVMESRAEKSEPPGERVPAASFAEPRGSTPESPDEEERREMNRGEEIGKTVEVQSGEIIPLFPDIPMREQKEEALPEPPPTAAPGKKKEKAAFLYDPMNHLQGYIEKAYRLSREKNRNVLLEGPWRPIIIMPDTREIWVEQSHAHLYALAVMPVRAEDVTMRILEKDEMPPEQSGSVQPLEAFLWKLAVRTARGRIPVGTDLRAPISLRHWPNLSRLMPIRHGLRISALWTKQPVSLMETATLLDIAPKYIFSFYSAARALDLIEQSKRQTKEKKPRETSSQSPEHKGFLSKILARLRGRGR